MHSIWWGPSIQRFFHTTLRFLSIKIGPEISSGSLWIKSFRTLVSCAYVGLGGSFDMLESSYVVNLMIDSDGSDISSSYMYARLLSF
jgi:hypothetical protein